MGLGKEFVVEEEKEDVGGFNLSQVYRHGVQHIFLNVLQSKHIITAYDFITLTDGETGIWLNAT